MVRLAFAGVLLLVSSVLTAADPKPRPDADGRPLPAEAIRRFGTTKFVGGPFVLTAFSRDGKTLYSVAQDGENTGSPAKNLTAWDADTGRKLWTAELDAYVLAVCGATDGKSLNVVTAKAPGSSTPLHFHRLAADTGKSQETRAVSEYVAYHPTVLPDGWHCFVQRGERLNDGKPSIAVVHDGAGKAVLRHTAADMGLELVRLSPDRAVVIVTGAGPQTDPDESHSPGYSRRLFAVSVKTGKELWSQDVVSADAVLSPDGKSVYTISSSRGVANTEPTIRRHDAATGKVLESRELPGADGSGWRNKRLLAVRPDGKAVYVRGLGGDTLVVDATTLKLESHLDIGLHEGWFAPDGKRAAAAVGRNLALHELPSGRPLERGATPLPGARWPAYRFSADGKTVTRVGGDTVVTWDTATGRQLGRVGPAKLLAEGVPGVPLTADNYPKKLAARSPDGKVSLVYTNPTLQQMQFDLTLKVGGKEWPDTGLTQRMVGVLQLAFTPDGRYALAQLDQEHLHIWDVTGDESGGNAITFATPGPSGFRQVPLMHPAPDSKRVALVEFDPKTPTLHKEAMARYQWRLGVYELDTRRRVSGLSGAGVLTAVDWSPDATRIGGAGRAAGAEAGTDRGFAFVATDTGAFVMPPTEFSRPATACALSPDARTLAVGTGGEIHLYEVRTGHVRHTFQPAGGEVLALRFHPDGRSLLSESADGAVTQWDVRGDLTPLPEPDAATLGRLWADLDSTDAATAFQAVRRIAAHPKKSLPFLKGKVAGEKRPTDAEIDGRVADLKSRVFAERHAAEKLLRAMGMIAHPALKVALATDSSPELRERATRLLAVTFTPATVRTTRLVEAVELAGTVEAKAVLTAWAGNAGPELTAEAMAALRRGRK